MTQATNPIITKITKVLRLASAQEGTPEGETAAKLAAQMMAAHAVTMAEIDLSGSGDPDPLEEQTVKLPQSAWRRNLAATVAEHCACRIAYTSWRGGGQRVTYYGHRTDIEVAQYLYTICERQIEREAQAYIRTMRKERWTVRGEPTDMPLYTSGQLRSLGNDFRRSAVAGLSSKLREIRTTVAEEGPAEEGTALVLARREKVDRWYEDLSSRFRAGRSSNYGHNSAGFEAGQNMSLHAGVSGTGNGQGRLEG